MDRYRCLITCNLEYIDHDGNAATPDELDPAKSYIKVKDYINDDNTFKINDFLLADPKTAEIIKPFDVQVLYKNCKNST